MYRRIRVRGGLKTYYTIERRGLFGIWYVYLSFNTFSELNTAAASMIDKGYLFIN